VDLGRGEVVDLGRVEEERCFRRESSGQKGDGVLDLGEGDLISLDQSSQICQNSTKCDGIGTVRILKLVNFRI
jgi:hypothetical protein